jgi:hypothetical protein
VRFTMGLAGHLILSCSPPFKFLVMACLARKAGGINHTSSLHPCSMAGEWESKRGDERLVRRAAAGRGPWQASTSSQDPYQQIRDGIGTTAATNWATGCHRRGRFCKNLECRCSSSLPLLPQTPAEDHTLIGRRPRSRREE